MEDQQVQQPEDLEFATPLEPASADPVVVLLLPDFLENSNKWMAAAKVLVESLPDVPDLEFQTQVIEELGQIVYTVDHAMESLDISDAHILLAVCLLFCQSSTLFLRSLLLRDPDDLHRALHIQGMLPQLCDPTDTGTPSSRSMSEGLDRFLTTTTTFFLDRWDPLELKLTQQRTGIPSDFVTRAESIVERANNILHIPAEICTCTPQSPLIHDLDWVITTVDDITEYCDPDDWDLIFIARLLAAQVVALQARFRLLGSIPDLDRSMFVVGIISQFQSSVSDLSHRDFHTFAFTDLEHIEDLDTKIAFGEELLGHPNQERRLQVSEVVAKLLLHRCTIRDSAVDGEGVLQLCEGILPFAIDEDRSAWLALRAHALLQLSFLGHQFTDLGQTLGFIEEGLGGSSEECKAAFLWEQLRIAAVFGEEQATVSAFRQIHDCHYMHYEGAVALFRKHRGADLLLIIEALKKTCTTCSRGEAFKSFAIILVIALLWQYFLQSGCPQHLRDAVSLRSQIGPPGSYGLDVLLYGAAAKDGFDGVEVRPKVVEAYATSSRGLLLQFPEVSGLEATPGQREVVGARGQWRDQFYSYVNSETWKDQSQIDLEAKRMYAYKRNSDDTSFLIAHRELLIQLSFAKDDRWQRHLALVSLGGLYSSRHRRQNEVKDLEHAVDWYQQGIDNLGADDQTTNAWRLRTIWADNLVRLHKITNSVQHPRLLQALDYYRQAAASTDNAPDNRLRSLDGWVAYFQMLTEDNMEHVLEVCELALSLLEEQGWAASSPRLSINSRHDRKELWIRVASLALLAGLNAGGVTKAVELIEASQASIWGQLRRLRVPLDDLEIVSPPLASRFRQLSRLLESRMGLLDADNELVRDLYPLGTDNWQINQDMNKVIEEIRTFPRFEKFLQRQSFDQDGLCEVAKYGPVVVLLDTGPAATALILHQKGSHFCPLPLTYDALRGLHRSLQVMANARYTHDGLDLVEESLHITVHPVMGPSNSAGNPRSLRKVGRNTSVQDLLEALWRQVVEPVLVEISRYDTNEKGKSKMWEIPKLEDRQRIWWCCQGEFSFLPVHAAGIYNRGSPICLSDFFISSYTPTLTALLDARARPIPQNIKVLAAAQPNPGGRWSRLTQVKDELKEIIQATPPSHLISLGDTDQAEPDYEGRYTTVENVLKKLHEASILHLACHGKQDMRDPLNSGFILANATELSIEELMKYWLPNAHTAILSACHTASNDAEQPDEAINLSSALMFLGFSNILGTKWPMYDPDGPVIAKAVYQALFDTTKQPETTIGLVSPEESTLNTDPTPYDEHHPTLASFSLANVVDSVARHLRLEKKVKAERWATFVHVGI